APTLHATGTSAVEAVPSPPVAVAAAESARQASSEPQAQPAAPATLSMDRQLRRWRGFPGLLALGGFALAALRGAGGFAPALGPTMPQPLELRRQAGVPLPAIPAPRRPAPPESRFDE